MKLKNIGHINPEVKYPCTNESISAVVAGLRPEENDIVVSVGGSLDMPLAIVPNASEVYAVDSNRSQVEFMQEQIEFLKNQDFEGFCRTEFLEKNTVGNKYRGFPCFDVNEVHVLARRDYFERKFSETRKSLTKIKIINLDILSFMESLDHCSVDKTYLSNILEWGPSKDICCIVNAMKVGGFVYDSSRGKLGLNYAFRTKRLKIDETRTKEARQIQDKISECLYSWEPSVYEKIE